MLCHELSCHKGRLLLSVLMLKDAGCNHYAVAGVDKVVSHESRQFADYGHKVLGHLRHLLGVTHSLVAPHCNVHRFSLPPLKRGRDPSAPPQVDQHAQCERLQGLAQLPRTPSRNCLKRGSGDAPGVYLASVSGPKWAEGDGLGTLCARVSGASGTFQTVSYYSTLAIALRIRAHRSSVS